MIRVKIKNLSQVVTHQADWLTQQDADNWINQIKQTGIWGKVAGEYPLSQLSQTEIATEISRREVDEFKQPLPEPLVTIPDQFTIEQTDVTSEYADQALKNESIVAIALGADLMADIRTLNKKKIANETMTQQQFQDLLSDSTAFAIERALWNGSFDTAKTLIQNFSGYYTTEEKAPLIAKIDAFLTQYP